MIIALLSDFGTEDYFVGAMKGAILSVNPDSKIVDITHTVPAHDILAACFTLRASHQSFPKNAIFLAVVDPGVGSERRAIIVETKNYKFVAPDNGLLSFVFDSGDDFHVFEILNDEFFSKPLSQTFHGRDLFAPVSAHLSNGVEASKFGREIKDFVRFDQRRPRLISIAKIEAQIIYIDRFGNLITNLSKEDLPEKFSITIGERRIQRVLTAYSESIVDEVFLILGSAGYFEIAIHMDSAKNLLGMKVNDFFTIDIC